MFLNELKKTFGKKTLLVLLCVMLLNGVLIVFGESDKGYNFTGEDYRKLYSAEDMHGDTETQLAYLNARLEENGMSRQYFLLRYVISDVEKVADYKGYLQSIADSAEKYSRLSIFMDGDEFSKRNVEKTAAVYASLPEIIPIPGKSRGVVMASWYNGSVMLGFIFVLYIVFLLMTREKEIGSLNLTMTTKHGHARHGAVKLAMCLIASLVSAFTLEAENWIIADIYYGLGDMSRPIQSIPEYQPSVFDISVFGFMLITAAFRILCVFMAGILVFFIACRSRSLPGLAGKLALVFGIEGALYYVVSGKSIWGLLKYINIYTGLDSQELLGNYMNLNLFGYPVWYLPVFIGFAVTVITAFSVLSLRAYERMQSLPGGCKLKLPRFSAVTSSAFIQECYRYFICERVLLILLVFALVRAITFSPVRETFAFQEDIYYKQYMLQLEGMYSENKEAEISGEDRKYAEITEKATSASAATDDDSKEGSLFIKEMYVSDVNGTQRKLLFSADDIEFSCIGRYENGYFLYGYYNSEDVTGEKLENDRSGMIVLDLKTEAIKRIDIDNGYGCHVWAMTIRDGCLYYGISYTAEDLSGYDYGDLTDADLADKLSRSMKNEIWRYNLEDESSELLFEVSGWLPRLALSYAHLYYSYDNKEHIVRNLEDGKECRLQREDVYMSPFMYSDGIVFTDNGEIEIWRYGTETAEKIGDFIPDGDISIVWITEKWVYADVFNSKEGYKMVYCSREKFMKGDFEWHEYNIK